MALTTKTIEVDDKGLLLGDWKGAKHPYLAWIDGEGNRNWAKLPKGKYECTLDENGVIVAMTPGLQITCDLRTDPDTGMEYADCHWVGLNWVCK